ncbi:hypothetical protein Bbelb_228620 [Branchiostoma belcheri]|nr:hypothetical protein Bbelb_228620 [Branchiostoma belcheri]
MNEVQTRTIAEWNSLSPSAAWHCSSGNIARRPIHNRTLIVNGAYGKGVPPNKDTKRSGKPQLRGPNPPQPPLEPQKRPISATFTERGIAAGVVSDNTEPTVTLVDGTQAAEAPRLNNSVHTYGADS